MRICLWEKRKVRLTAAALVAILILCIAASVMWLTAAADNPVVAPVYQAPAGKNLVALMINVDWGEEILPAMLEALAKEKIKATFFISGRFAERQAEMVRTIAAAGHEIANHGYSHPHVDRLSINENQNEIIKTSEALKAAGVTESPYFATPYGEKKEHVIQAAEALNYKVIFWTLDTVDWKEPSVDTILQRIVPKAADGALILAHPKACTVDAIPGLAAGIREKGLEFASLSDILAE
ncbi:MAG: polysaccharide deacetylase family protein [Clostridiales bacterium]